jgi:hypothetical protein
MGKSWQDLREASKNKDTDPYAFYNARNRNYDIFNIAHPFTGIHVTEKGFDMLEEYVYRLEKLLDMKFLLL